MALRRSKVQTQPDVLAGKSPAIQLTVNVIQMKQAFAGSSQIQGKYTVMQRHFIVDKVSEQCWILMKIITFPDLSFLNPLRQRG
jgi:hypothetical protein